MTDRERMIFKGKTLTILCVLNLKSLIKILQMSKELFIEPTLFHTTEEDEKKYDMVIQLAKDSLEEARKDVPIFLRIQDNLIKIARIGYGCCYLTRAYELIDSIYYEIKEYYETRR